ncbi:hypothetical protein EMIHUDRAFT_423887, partial [Emiliania huxleyi CCMP1516]|uniref:Uncharacterized protein n=2 Tax=Emiliania huxleyi TaxID=2903 RepID=A0A0D3K6A0_EMIH1
AGSWRSRCPPRRSSSSSATPPRLPTRRSSPGSRRWRTQTTRPRGCSRTLSSFGSRWRGRRRGGGSRTSTPPPSRRSAPSAAASGTRLARAATRSRGCSRCETRRRGWSGGAGWRPTWRCSRSRRGRRCCPAEEGSTGSAPRCASPPRSSRAYSRGASSDGRCRRCYAAWGTRCTCPAARPRRQPRRTPPRPPARVCVCYISCPATHIPVHCPPRSRTRVWSVRTILAH